MTLARAAIAELAEHSGASREQVDAIRIAVSEAVTNAVVHAYADGSGSVHLTAGVAGRELWVLVADDGRGFQVPSSRPGLGWGLPLIADASEGLVIAERAEGGTEVRMRFRIDEVSVASQSEGGDELAFGG